MAGVQVPQSTGQVSFNAGPTIALLQLRRDADAHVAAGSVYPLQLVIVVVVVVAIVATQVSQRTWQIS